MGAREIESNRRGNIPKRPIETPEMKKYNNRPTKGRVNIFLAFYFPIFEIPFRNQWK